MAEETQPNYEWKEFPFDSFKPARHFQVFDVQEGKPDDMQPLTLFIIPSGWRNKYHVIREEGDTGDIDYYTYTSEEILDKFKITV